MARVYATEADYRTWTGDNTATASAQVLTRASLLVDRALVGAVYAVNDQGLPTDTDVTAALRDAVCAQVAWWVETGDTTGAGAAMQFASASIGSANYSRAGDSGTKSDGKAVTYRLDATALDILTVAGLLPVAPYVQG